MTVFFSVLAILVIALIAIGARAFPKGKQSLAIIFGKRLGIRIGEGLGWWPRFLGFGLEEHSILEDEIVVIRDDQPDGRTHETIMTKNGVEVIVRNVSVFYSVARHDAVQPGGFLWAFAKLLGWEPGQDLLAYSQLADANESGEKNEIVRKKKLSERIREIFLPALRVNVRAHRYQDLLGLTIEGENAPPIDQTIVDTTTDQLTETLLVAVQKRAHASGVTITLVLIGDIDPPQVIKDSLLAQAVAVGEKAAALVRFDAIEVIIGGLLKLAKVENPSLEQVTSLYAEIRGKDNAQLAAMKTGDLGRILQNLAGGSFLQAAVTSAA